MVIFWSISSDQGQLLGCLQTFLISDVYGANQMSGGPIAWIVLEDLTTDQT